MKSHDLYKKGWHPSSEDPGRGTDPAGHRSSHKLCTGAIFRGGMQTAAYFVLSKYLPHIYNRGYKSVCSQ